MEVLRYYPIAATLTRYAADDFEFAGYHIHKGERLMVAPAATHFSPEFFKEPDKFDPDRFSPPRSEHKQKGVYSPYGAGTHTCMGASMAEVQVPLTLVALLLLQVVFPHPESLTRRDIALLIVNGLFIGAGIVANLAFEVIGLDLYVVVLLAALALYLLRREGAQPLVVYYSTAYTLGLIVTLVIKLVRR